MKAHLADQKQTLVFQQDDAGTALLYHFQIADRDIETLHHNLLADGVAFHTIVPHIEVANVVDVYVADPDGSAHDAVAKAAERYNADVTYYTGKAEFIGTTKEDGSDREQRDDARRNYEEIIQQSPVPESKAVWSRIHNNWGEALGVNYGLVPGDVEKFHALKGKWATVNNDLLAYVDQPDGPEARAKIGELEAIVKEMSGLHADPGTPAGIGLPGGPRDVLVVGAGPGGLAASINGAAEGLDTLVVEANLVAGGQAKFSSRIENFGGFPIGVTGERLTRNMFEQAKRLGAEAKLGVRVTGMTYDPNTGMKTVTLSNGEKVDTRTVIIAGGLEFRRLPFDGSDGPGVIVGDGKALVEAARGGGVCVIGGSNGAAQAALGCAQHCDKVYLLARSPIVDSMSDYQVAALRNNPKITVIESDSISKLWRDEHGEPQMAETAKGQKFPVKAVGLFLGSVPDTKWVPSDITIAKGGRVNTNSELETSLPGVFAVGDIRDGAIGRIGVAYGEGQMALRNANVFLDKQRIPKTDALTLDVDTHTHTLITELFDLDRAHPWFGQTAEGVTPLKKRGGSNAQELGKPSAAHAGHPGEGYSAAARIGADGVIQTTEASDVATAIVEKRAVKYYARQISDVADFSWEPDKHPRGQPENKGQFGPGGGGAEPIPEHVKPTLENIEAAKSGIEERFKELTTKGPDKPAPTGGGRAVTPEERDYVITAVKLDLSLTRKEAQTQPVKDLDELYEKAFADEAGFKDEMTALAADFGAEVKFAKGENGTTLKKRATSERKVNTEYNGDASQLRDVLRSTIVSTDVVGTREAAYEYIKQKGDDIVRVKDRIMKSVEGGYRDILVNVRTASGLIAEVQFNSKNMLNAKLGRGHEIYELIRTNRTAMSKEQLLAFEKELSDLYTKAYENDGNGKGWQLATVKR